MDSTETKTKSISSINGVVIETEGNVTHFYLQKSNDEQKQPKQEKLPWYKKVVKWIKDRDIMVYFKARDLADPFGDRANDQFDTDVGSDGKTVYEAGIKIKF